MKLVTKIPVTYNSGITGSETGIVEGRIINVAFSGDGSKLGANYAYTTPEDSEGKFTIISQGARELVDAEIEGLFNSIQADIPGNQDYRTTELTKYYLGFRVLMAETFSVNVSDIDIL